MLGVERRAAAHRRPEAPTQRLAHWRPDKPVEGFPEECTGRIQDGGSASHTRLPAPSEVGRHLEQPALGRIACDLRPDTGGEALIEARHGQEDCRTNACDVLLEEVDRSRKGDRARTHHRKVAPDRALEGVGQWKMRQQDVVGARRDDLSCCLRIPKQRKVGKHDALRAAGRARRVDEGGECAGIPDIRIEFARYRRQDFRQGPHRSRIIPMFAGSGRLPDPYLLQGLEARGVGAHIGPARQCRK